MCMINAHYLPEVPRFWLTKNFSCALLLEGVLDAGPLCSVYHSCLYILTSRGFTGISHIVESEMKYVTGFTKSYIFDSLFPKIDFGIVISQKHCTKVSTVRHGRDWGRVSPKRQEDRDGETLPDCASHPPTWLDMVLQRWVLFASKHCL